MNKKSRALKALLFLAIFVAMCMYLSRTVQTITTPKVKLTQASNGRIEQKIAVTAKAYFPSETEYTFTLAKDYPITIDKVYVKEGLYVQKGDTIFTALLNDYQTKEKELLDSYNQKAQELIDLDIANRKSSKQSAQNDLYDEMILKQNDYSTAQSNARLAAAKEGIDLTFDLSLWQSIAITKNASTDVLRLIAAAQTSKELFETARTDFYNSYENRKLKVDADVFKYINERNALEKELQKLSDDMVALLNAKQTLSVVTAPAEGYITQLSVENEGSYDGQTVAFCLAKAEDEPVLRIDITDLKQEVPEKTRVEFTGDYDTYKSKVTTTEEDKDGHEYAIVELSDDVLLSAGGMRNLLQTEGTEATLVLRSSKNATIIPASALRNEGGSEYIFVTDHKSGGFLSASNTVAKKMNVNVIDRSDTAVSIQEDLSYQQIIERADRTIENDMAVMEFLE